MRALSLILSLAVLQTATLSVRAAETSDYRLKYDTAVVEKIDTLIRQSWEDNEVSPSQAADDITWLRRVYLDTVGHIPPLNVVEEFVKNKDANKYQQAVDTMLDGDSYVNNWTTIWTNLLIGRQTPDRTSREGMQKFLREAFAKDRPWDDVVYDILTAEGHFEENGAVNYLLSQMTMRDEGVQATAKTTRLFLGTQVQCTQCHNHPFNDWQQSQFWEFNSFFRAARRIDHDKIDPNTGQEVDDYSELTTNDFSGPVFFEKRSGLMQVAYPKYFGKDVEFDNGKSRQKVLADAIVSDDNHQMARAMVNRMWGHFFGYGFTRPVDDMGPHNPASHPILLEHLTESFVASDYNMKMLVRWITSSEAYRLSSEFNPKNEMDNPAAGEMPLFSHMYIKSMEAEQLFDSLMVASNASGMNRANYAQAMRQRNEWLQQFVTTFGTDENDEATTFNGSIPQALMMMNGELVDTAVKCDPGTLLHQVVTADEKDSKKVQLLYLAALGRNPSGRDLAAVKKLMQISGNPIMAYQDLYWALLNSNEFIFVR
ncbi:DUF1549 and DUF1553 domain-containing protein [Rubinisphaera sp.]|uniref:DUF1549 and DUF1553 domain-containing protein n=1 Tax=Rubinisphaera sp. TaxID=2024857 RepID=UPI000C0F3C0F|nr:DUF1549 and DUF1553 domain-containing protein [Rubinisphaera sp.]MBV11977.1 hypothetical protein [Rubinisphaera sp.]HCS55247.1 hypothetical protein [Planctomycetaceae bacterium]|tara:strand:+ start:3669 stop:5288 length:1620 start_codon:yes stop_codon:yes gene_type:complete